MKVICAWCNKVLSSDNKPGGDSHGICDKCSRQMQKEIEDRKKKGK